MKNKKGFAIAGVLYPILILFLALLSLLLMNLTQENFRLRKSVKELTSKINGEEPKDMFKQKVEDILNCNGVENCAPSCTNFGLSDGAMTPSFGYTGDTSDLNGRFYKMMDGRTGVLIDDGTYCAYKTTGMQKLAVGEGKECENAILDDTGTGIGLICPTDEELEASCNNTINSLKTTIASATASAGDVLTGKTYVKPDATIGNGTMPINSGISKSLGFGETYTIPAGYHDGTGTVTNNTVNKGAITGTVGMGGTYSSTQNGYVTTINITGPTASGTYNATTRGASLDMGATNTYRYVNTNSVPNTNSGTYTPTSRNEKLDMGATNTYRYVNTNSVPNTNSGTYTYAANSTGGTVDLGATNTYRYVNAANVYAKGKADAGISFTKLASAASGKRTTSATGTTTANGYALVVVALNNNVGTSGYSRSCTYNGSAVSSSLNLDADDMHASIYYFPITSGKQIVATAKTPNGNSYAHAVAIYQLVTN